MTAPTPNAELAYKVLDYIEAHPEQHDQDEFLHASRELDELFDRREFVPVTTDVVIQHCGTTACFAGWTALLSGKTLHASGNVRDDDGRTIDIERAAADLLGIDQEAACDLFYGADDLGEVRDAVAEIFGPRPDAAA